MRRRASSACSSSSSSRSRPPLQNARVGDVEPDRARAAARACPSRPPRAARDSAARTRRPPRRSGAAAPARAARRTRTHNSRTASGRSGGCRATTTRSRRRAATESPNIGRFASIHSSFTRSSGSSPSSRRAACSACSKRVIATWRNTVANASSSFPHRSARRTRGSVSSRIRRRNTSISPNTLAVSAVVSGVSCSNSPCADASDWCTPWPSSCATVITSRRLPV